jgi:plastocyanin
MKAHGPLAALAALAACATSSKPHATSGTFEDCYYDCKPGAKPSEGSGAPAAPGPAAAPAATPGKPGTPVGEKAASLREAADLLDKAEAKRAKGEKSVAEHYFATAELITAPTQKIDVHVPAQPRTAGSSEAEDAEAKVAPPPVEGSLTGSVMIDGKPLASAFGLVTLEPASGKWPARTAKHRTVEQRNREFLPHVTAVPVGSTVSFPNFDNLFHNVFSTSSVGAFDLGIYKAGEAREFTFEKEGIVRLGCNLHANMSAYIVVVAAPAYVITDDKGAFAFKHLAPGKYKLKAWSERTKTPLVQDVTIKAGKNELTVGVAGDAPAGPQPDKFGGKRG